MSSRRRPPVFELTAEHRRIGIANLRRLGLSKVPAEHLELEETAPSIEIDRGPDPLENWS